MLKLGERTTFRGMEVEVVGKRRTKFGEGPIVYELAVLSQKRTYIKDYRELKVVKGCIAYVPDEELRRVHLKEATKEQLEALNECVVVGFVNVPEEKLAS